MNHRPVFQRYLLKSFFLWFCTVTAALATIIFIFNTSELLRRSHSLPHFKMAQILRLSCLQLPGLIDQMIPFSFLFATMFLMWNLYRRSELVVLRAAGLSIWSLMAPIVMGVFIYSTVHLFLFDPIISATQQAKERLQSKLFAHHQTAPKSLATMSPNGLWVRQISKNGYTVINAKKISNSLPGEGPLLRGVTLYDFSATGRFLRRYDVQEARITRKGWNLSKVLLTESTSLLEPVPDFVFPTGLTLERLQKSFNPPTTFSLWDLPKFISLIEASGFSSTDHKLYLYTILTKPFLILAVCMLGCLAAFSVLRRNSNSIFIMTGLGLGFGLYLLHHLLFSLGETMHFPLILSASVPALVTLLLSLSLLIHLEEG